MEDFLNQYLEYTNGTEAPAIYHRWSILTALGAYIGRSYYVKFGHFNIYPNLYTILIGGAGSRKNTAINIAKTLLRKSGYLNIAATKTTKEKFFIDMSEQGSGNTQQVVDDFLDQNLFGSKDPDANKHVVHEIFIGAGEFNTFFGNNILDFLSDLGELWDYEGAFESKIKNGKSITVYNPTISILGGNTPTTFANSFPPEIIGQGFFSRTLLIYGERTRDKITFPEAPSDKATELIIGRIKRTRGMVQQELHFSPEARNLIDKIYKSPELIEDSRFESFYNRRLTILIKLGIIIAVVSGASQIHAKHILYANTILSHAEQLMPKALGEFGRAKNSDVSHKVMQTIYNHHGVITFQQMWAVVHTDLEQIKDLQVIVQNLVEAGKVQYYKGTGGATTGFLPKRKILEIGDTTLVDYSLLTEEERRMKK